MRGAPVTHIERSAREKRAESIMRVPFLEKESLVF